MISFLAEELRDLKAQHLLRELRLLSDIRGARAMWRGKPTLLFCGNDYLGLSQHPRLIQALQESAKIYGVGAGASRLISGTSDLHDRAEKKLATFKGKEAALLFSSGYAANLGILSALAGPKDWVVLDKLCHASLIDGAKLSGATVRVFPHKNYQHLRDLLQKKEAGQRAWVVTDSVFSMDGDIADLEELVQIKNEFGAYLIVDDAHGTGVLGKTGRGAAEDLGLEKDIDILMGTTSKAFGCLGGFVAGDTALIQYLVNHARSFIYSTALPSCMAAVIEEAVNIIQTEPEIRQRLWRNVHQLADGLKRQGWIQAPVESPIFPIIVGPEENALRYSKLLAEQGILVPAIRTPTVPKGKARLRVSVSALHSEEDIAQLLNAFSHLGKSIGFDAGAGL